jgi:hypothetical protein
MRRGADKAVAAPFFSALDAFQQETSDLAGGTSWRAARPASPCRPGSPFPPGSHCGCAPDLRNAPDPGICVTAWGSPLKAPRFNLIIIKKGRCRLSAHDLFKKKRTVSIAAHGPFGCHSFSQTVGKAPQARKHHSATTSSLFIRFLLCASIGRLSNVYA